MSEIAFLAAAAGVRQDELIALTPNNDPFMAASRPARRRNAEWLADLWQALGFAHGTHVRRIHYRLVSADPKIRRPDGRGCYLNTAAAWSLLVNATRDARYLHLIPEGAIDDRGSPPPITHFNAIQPGELRINDSGLWLADLDEAFPDLPAIEFTNDDFGPPALVEIWAEKTTMNGILIPLARRYGVNLVTGAGEMSETSTRLFLDRVREGGVPGHILYVSDFDPAGRSMPVAVARKIEFALHQSGEDLDVTLDPLVLTEQQCRDYRLPRTPIKESERRGAKFEERFGRGATELDALEALHSGELAKIVAAGIERHIDPDHARRHAVALQEYRHQLVEISREVHDQHSAEIDGLRDEYGDLVTSASDWKGRAASVFKRIADHLQEVAVSGFEPPDPAPRPSAPEPLFSSGRNYLDQMEAYRRWQGRADA